MVSVSGSSWKTQNHPAAIRRCSTFTRSSAWSRFRGPARSISISVSSALGPRNPLGPSVSTYAFFAKEGATIRGASGNAAISRVGLPQSGRHTHRSQARCLPRARTARPRRQRICTSLIGKRIIRAIILKGRAALPLAAPAGSQPPPRTRTSFADSTGVDRPTPLAGPVAALPRAIREEANDAALGGMRSPHLAQLGKWAPLPGEHFTRASTSMPH